MAGFKEIGLLFACIVILCAECINGDAGNIQSTGSNIATGNCGQDGDDFTPNTYKGVAVAAPSDEDQLLHTTVYTSEIHRHELEPVEEDTSSSWFLTKRHQCGYIDSCFGRCGSGPSDKDSIFSYLQSGQGPSSLTTTFTCFCDMQCSSFGDCCKDFSRYCGFGIASGDRDIYSDIKTEFANDSDESPDTSGPLVTGNDANEIAGFLVEHSDHPESLYECVHVDGAESGSLWVQTACHADWQDVNIEVLCYNIDVRDDIAILLVQDENAITYRNIFCAQCNFVKVFWFWILDSYCYGELPRSAFQRPEVLSAYLKARCLTKIRVPFGQIFRPCLEVVGTCANRKQHDSDFESLRNKCMNGHQSLVTFDTTSSTIKGSTVYRNAFCAECSGVDPSEITCPTKEMLQEHYLQNSTKTEALLQHIISKGGTEDVTNRIVTNYNIRGSTSTTVVYQENGYIVPIVNTCDEGKVFDPYLGECRQLYCNDGYVLTHDKCIPSKATDELDEADVVEIQQVLISAINETLGLDDEIVVTIKVILDVDIPDKNKNKSGNPGILIPEHSSPDILLLNGTGWEIYINTLPQYNTNPDNADDTIYELTITMVFEDPSMFPSGNQVARLISQLANLNSAKEIYIYINGVCIFTGSDESLLLSKVIEGNVTDLNYLLNRCSSGNVTVIDSNDFVMYNGNNSAHEACPVIYVNSTSKVYDCTDNYIFGYDPSKPSNEQHYGAIVCESPSPLDPSCELLLLNETECEILPNGSMITQAGDLYSPDEYYVTPEGIEICNEYSNVISEVVVIFFNFSDPQLILMYVGLVISTLCVLACVITYIMFGELRKLPGVNRMSLMVASVGGNIAMLVGISLHPGSFGCQIIAITTHYFFLTRLFWTNAILIHAFQTFGPKFDGSFARRVVRFNSSRSQFRQHAPYALYAWGVPMSVVTLGTVWHFCECGPLAVYYGSYLTCFIADPSSFIYLFCVPLSVILIFNIVLYIPTVYSIQVSSTSSPRHARRVTKHHNNRHLSIYAKLSTTSGFCWLFAILAAFTHLDWMWYLFIVFMSLEGLFIFFAFFCTRRIKNLYYKRFSQKCNPPQHNTLSLRISRGVYSISDKVENKPSGESDEAFKKIGV